MATAQIPRKVVNRIESKKLYSKKAPISTQTWIFVVTKIMKKTTNLLDINACFILKI